MWHVECPLLFYFLGTCGVTFQQLFLVHIKLPDGNVPNMFTRHNFYFYLLSTWVSQEVSFGAEVTYSGVSIRISSRMGSCSTDLVYHCGPALTPSAEQHPWKVTAPRNDRLEPSDVAPSVCSSVLVFSASGGV